MQGRMQERAGPVLLEGQAQPTLAFLSSPPGRPACQVRYIRPCLHMLGALMDQEAEIKAVKAVGRAGSGPDQHIIHACLILLGLHGPSTHEGTSVDRASSADGLDGAAGSLKGGEPTNLQATAEYGICLTSNGCHIWSCSCAVMTISDGLPSFHPRPPAQHLHEKRW